MFVCVAACFKARAPVHAHMHAPLRCMHARAARRWLEVLRCISRWELLQQIASGMPTDAVLFAGASAGDKGGGGKAAAALRDQLRQLGAPGGGRPGAAARRCPVAVSWQRRVILGAACKLHA